MKLSRRDFFRSALATASLTALGPNFPSFARTIPQRIGLELYTLRKECEKDLPGTLEKVRRIGYAEVEFAGFYNHQARDIRRMLDHTGLACPSAQFAYTEPDDWKRNLDFARQLGLRYLVCPLLPAPAFPHQTLAQAAQSLDTFRRAADILNQAGELTMKAGLRLAYHNHNYEFHRFGGATGYDELLRRTDPRVVSYELDVYWMAEAGRDPAHYLAGFPGRYPLLHVKDRKRGATISLAMSEQTQRFTTEVGSGTIDWEAIFAAARNSGTEHFFVEQDHCEIDPLESVGISYSYLRHRPL